MTSPDRVAGVFSRPFTEQVAFFRRKLGNLVPTRRWDDMLREAHDDGFMVAGATSAELLNDLGTAVDKAIAEGTGIEAFRKDFRSIVARNGWTGWTGEGSVKGEAWRVGVIYRTNMSTSYAAGRHAQLTAGKFAFWVYRHGDSREPRPEHLSWNGLILPPEHPFWARHYPPSDWGCSCYVVGASSMAAAKRLGGDPNKKLPGNWQEIDQVTGAPVGIGRGWDYAPGASVSHLVNAIAGKIGAWHYQISKAFMNLLPAARADAVADAYRALPSTADQVRRYAERVYEPAPDLPALPPQRTLGRLRTDQAAEIRSATGAELAGYDLSIDEDAIRHVLDRHGPGNESDRKQRPVTAADFALLPEIINSPDAIELERETRAGEQLVSYRKTIGGAEHRALFAVRGTKRRTLALKTMFIKR